MATAIVEQQLENFITSNWADNAGDPYTCDRFDENGEVCCVDLAEPDVICKSCAAYTSLVERFKDSVVEDFRTVINLLHLG
jgi:hypothetical protein